MNILWVSEVFPDPNSGAGGTELLMVEHLRQLGHRVDTVWAADLPRRIRHGNLHYVLELPRTYWRAIEQRCQRADYDVVTVNLGQSYLAAEMLKKRQFSGIFVVRSHGLDDHLEQVLAPWRRQLRVQQPVLWRRLAGRILQAKLGRQLRRAAEACDGYVVSNSLDAEFLEHQHGLNPDRIACIPQAPAAALTNSPTAPMTAERIKRILYVANFHYAKGPHAVAEAARQLLHDNTDRSMTWICHPHDHDRVRTLLGEKTAERVRLLGWLPQGELVREFDSHGIFLYPSLFDGFGKVFLEAMSRGLCVIGTEAGGMVDIIRDGRNGFLCQFDNADEIIQHVGTLSTSLEFAKKISAAALASSGQYTWERVGRELTAFFRSMLAAKGVIAGKNDDATVGSPNERRL